VRQQIYLRRGPYIDFVAHLGQDSLFLKKDDELCLLNTTKYQIKAKNALGVPHGARAVFAVEGTIFVSMKDKKLLIFDSLTLKIKDIKS